MANNKSSVESRESLHKKLQWLIFCRALVVTVLLGATAIMQGRESQSFLYASPRYLYVLIASTFILTVIYALILNRVRNLKAFAYVQIFIDALFISLLITLTGGIESIFSWVYVLSIFSAGIILYRRGGLLVASVCSILYGLLLDLEFYGLILPLGGPVNLGITYKSSYVFYLIAMNMVAFYFVAILSAYLSEQLRRKESELKEREIDFDQLEKLYKHIVENVGSGLITIDVLGRITSFNRMAAEITGYTKEDVYHQDIQSLFPEISQYELKIGSGDPILPLLGSAGSPDPEKGNSYPIESSSTASPSHTLRQTGGFPTPLSSQSDKAKLFRREIKFQRRDSNLLTLGLSVSPLKDANHQEIGSILIFQDLTRLREMEEDLQRADRLAAMGELAAGMAHEIRNPMASISGSIEILKDGIITSAQSRKLMDIVLRELNRLNSLISDFLLFARPLSKGKELIHLNEIMEETLKIFINNTEYDHRVRFTPTSQDDLMMKGDPQQIEQVFWNLFLNAVQAMPSGGELQVELRKINSSKIETGISKEIVQDRGNLKVDEPSFSPSSGFEGRPLGEIKVSDTGTGIDEKDLGKIFNPFFTTKKGGTGLGLSIVYSIVESHGGKITVRSQLGKGTIFFIYFPIQDY